MKLETRTLVFLAAAAGVLVVVLALPSRRASSEPATPAPAHAAPVAPPAAGALDEGALLVAQRRRAAELTWTRNPFAPATSRVPALPRRVEPAPAPAGAAAPRALTGISIRGSDRRAVVGGRIVQEGELLASGHTVASITAHAVTLSRGGEELVLLLGEER